MDSIWLFALIIIFKIIRIQKPKTDLHEKPEMHFNTYLLFIV
jgi:hypothetical protein